MFGVVVALCGLSRNLEVVKLKLLAGRERE